ncbi:MAG: hypothetical protein ACOY4K_08765 [Pseudomonadota bacterium]
MRIPVLTAAAAAALATLSAAAPALAREAPSAGCAALEAQAEAALGAEAVAVAASVGYPGLADAPGCLITFSGDGTVFGTRFQAVADRLGAALTAAGWTQDHNADADGPTGTATGYRKGGEAVAVSVAYDTPEGVCRQDAPAASCHPTAAQMAYTITLGLRPGS